MITGRFTVTVDNFADLHARIEVVLADPELGGFDCMLKKDVVSDPEATAYRQALLVKRGIRVKLFAETEHSTDTHWAARLVIVRPDKIGGDGHVLH